MRSASKWAMVFLATAGLVFVVGSPTKADSTTQPSADTREAVGSITGTVMKDGKPLANARVGLIDAAEVRNRRAGKGAKGAGATSGQKPQRPTPTATAMTDSDGKFTINDVKAGEYMVMAGAKGEGRGRAHTSIASGETATVEIQVMQGGGGGGGKAGKAGKQAKGN